MLAQMVGFGHSQQVYEKVKKYIHLPNAKDDYEYLSNVRLLFTTLIDELIAAYTLRLARKGRANSARETALAAATETLQKESLKLISMFSITISERAARCVDYSGSITEQQPLHFVYYKLHFGVPAFFIFSFASPGLLPAHKFRL